MVNLNFGGALLVILLIDAFLFMGQSAVSDVLGYERLNGNYISIGSEGDLLSKNMLNGTYVLDTSEAKVKGDFIAGTPVVQAGTLDLFVDTFTAIKEWFFDVTGLSIAFEVLGGPYYYCTALQLELDPNWFCFSIGAVWYILTLFLAIAFATGK